MRKEVFVGRKYGFIYIVISISILFLSGCPKPPIGPVGSLRDMAASRNIRIGAAVDPTKFSETAYDNTCKTEFNMLVAENVMKMDTIHPSATTYNYSPADLIMTYAQNNGMTVRGHALLWHNQVPGWVTAKPYSELIAVMQSHIDNVLTHFKGKIHSWDVVNEVVKDNGLGLRNNDDSSSIWADSLTDDSIIKEAFYRARAVDPDAKLIINDYSNEAKGSTKADKLYSLVAGWVGAGVPIDGVGFQLHLMESSTPNYTAIRQNIDRYIALKPGFQVQFTEIDVRISEPASQSELDNQASIYANLMRIALDYYPNVTVFVTWGITDKYSWIPSVFSGYGSALLFDGAYAPKPAYHALVNALR